MLGTLKQPSSGVASSFCVDLNPASKWFKIQFFFLQSFECRAHLYGFQDIMSRKKTLWMLFETSAISVCTLQCFFCVLCISAPLPFKGFMRSTSQSCTRALNAQSCSADHRLNVHSYFKDISLLRVSLCLSYAMFNSLS